METMFQMILLFSKRTTGVITCGGKIYKLLHLISMSNNMNLMAKYTKFKKLFKSKQSLVTWGSS